MAVVVGFIAGFASSAFGVGWFDGDLGIAALCNLGPIAAALSIEAG